MRLGIFYMKALPYQLLGRVSQINESSYEVTDTVRIVISGQVTGSNQVTFGASMIPEIHFRTQTMRLKRDEDFIAVADFEKVSEPGEVRHYESLIQQMAAKKAGLHSV